MDGKMISRSRWTTNATVILVLVAASGCSIDKLSAPFGLNRNGVTSFPPMDSQSTDGLNTDALSWSRRQPRIATEQAPPALQQLGEQLQSASPQARAVAIAQLGEIARRGDRGSYPAIELLTRVMQNDDEMDVRIAATDALAGIENPAASASLDALVAQTSERQGATEFELEEENQNLKSKPKLRLSFLPSFLR